MEGGIAGSYKGPIAILVATALMAFQDAIVQWLTNTLPLWEFFMVRSIFVIPILVLFATRNIKQLTRVLKPWPLLRSGLLVSMYIFYYAGLPRIDLSVVAATYYTAPLFILLLSVIFLRERVTRAQVIAFAMAFGGVLVIVRPAEDRFDAMTLMPLVAALMYALAAVTTKGRVFSESPWVLVLSLNIVFAVVGMSGAALLLAIRPEASAYPFLLSPWAPLTLSSLATVVALGMISIGIHLFLAKAYQAGPTGVVAVLDYAYLCFASLWTLVLFGRLPQAHVILGTLLIVLSGLLSLWSGMAASRRPAEACDKKERDGYPGSAPIDESLCERKRP